MEIDTTPEKNLPKSPNAFPATKKVHIKTWGCQMNVADSEQMIAQLEDESYQTTDLAEEADLIILNTCHIRDKAKQKALSSLGRIKDLKKQNPNLKIAVTGCVPQIDSKSLIKSAPYIDFMVGPGQISNFSQVLNKSLTQTTGEKTKPETAFKFDTQYKIAKTNAKRKVLEGKNTVSRFVNINTGCNNYCTFCVVPFTRGKEISRPEQDILKEMEELVKEGCKEVTLLGQNVNSYGFDLPFHSDSHSGKLDLDNDHPFSRLLDKAAQVEGIERVRFTTSNPHDFTLSIAQTMAKHESLGKYLHLPVQSGSNSILAAMKRKVTREEYLTKVEWLRNAVPGMSLSTDLIVGFPGETQEDFEETLSLIEKVRYDFIYSFCYSPRPKTPAARFPNQIDEAEKKKRLNKLNALQEKISTEIMQAQIGRTSSVLFLYESDKLENCYYGRDAHFRLVRCLSNRNLIGKTCDVMIESANKTALQGILL